MEQAEVANRVRELGRMHMLFGGEVLAGPDPTDAEPHLRAAVTLAPELGPAWGLLGKALLAGERTDDAVAALRRAMELQPGNALARSAYGSALLLLGRFREGWEHWAASRALLPKFGPPEREWTGRQPIAGKTLLIVCCDGFGDTFQFCRFAPVLAAAGARVVLAAQAETLTLLRRLEGVAEVVDRSGRAPAFDLWTDDKILPVILGCEPGKIPLTEGYVRADPARVAAMRARLPDAGGRRRAALIWGGDPRNDQDASRSLPLGRAAALLAPLLALPYQWCALQLGPRRDELAGMPGVLDLAPGLGDFADTAAILACMDWVVGVETGPTHLACAMGRPAVVLLAHRPDWRWLMAGERSPWYESARLCRQKRTGDWASALDAAAAVLR